MAVHAYSPSTWRGQGERSGVQAWPELDIWGQPGLEETLMQTNKQTNQTVLNIEKNEWMLISNGII